MTKEEKFKMLIDYILESEEQSYYSHCLDKVELLYDNIFSKHKSKHRNEYIDEYMSKIKSEEYLNSINNEHIYAYAKLLQKHLKLN